MILRKLTLVSLFVLASLCAYCQVSVSSYVDKSNVDVSEDINLTISVKAPTSDIPAPSMPSLPNFNIYSSGQSRSVSMINGKVNSLLKFNYILSPRFAGKSTIGVFTVVIDGKTYKTEPIDVEVSRSAVGNAEASLGKSSSPKIPSKPKQGPSGAIASSAALPDFYMTAVADRTEAYLNEQINLKIRFYQAQSTLGNPQYDRPRMEGLVFEEIKTNQDFEVMDGKQYVYTEFTSALFGILPGTATVGTASVEYRVADNIADTFDLFFGAAGGVTKTVKSSPIQINIKALPKAGRTKNFYGAVGTGFTVASSVDNSAPQAGEPVTLTVTVKGNGNMRAISDIPAPDLGDSFRVYETTSSSATKINGAVVGGSKVYKTIIVPRASGSFVLPEVSFTYFDTLSNSYRTISTMPINLTVSQPTVSKASSTVSFTGSDNMRNAQRVEKITKDITYIKSGALSVFTLFLMIVVGLGSINYMLFVIILAAIIIRIINKNDISLFGKKKAYMEAKRDLSKAKTLSDVSGVLADYLEAKLKAPIGIMTIADVALKLRLSRGAADKLAALWQEFEMLKYAPASSLTDSIAVSESSEKTLNIIKEIEKEIK